jgi:hypothetical protein
VLRDVDWSRETFAVCGVLDYVGVVSQPPRKARSAPKFTAFLLTGAVAGLLIGCLLSVIGPVDTSYDASSVLGFLGLIFAGLGMLVGGIVAVLLERWL